MSKSNNLLSLSSSPKPFKKDLNEEDIEKQEHLSNDRFKRLVPKYKWNCHKSNALNVSGAAIDRPIANLIDLMHWSILRYGISDLTNKENLQPYIHNKIVIDGAFLQFCEENDVKVECLMKDSTASWKTDKDSEHFMAQGVFRISTDKFDFLHCALFHKGNQNEDEVSFFIIASDDIFEQYVELRNLFDKWLVARDRDHLEIHVVGGSGIPYDRKASWDDLFLEESLKLDIKNYVEGFLNSKHIYDKLGVAYKTGALLWGNVGVGKTSLIRTIIAQYDFKPVTVQSSAQTNDDTITEAFEYAGSQEPALLYIEDLDTMLDRSITLSHFLNLMDGVSNKKGLMVIATANDLSKLKESIVDRPSRFDRKFEFPLPDLNMSIIYLNKWFNGLLKESDIKKIAKETVENKFSFAYLKELYIGSIYTALADKREIPTLKDVNITKKRMLKDKENVKNGFELAGNSGEIGFE
jgi:hypothetical protein